MYGLPAVSHAAGLLSSPHQCYPKEEQGAIKFSISATIGVARMRLNTTLDCLRDFSSWLCHSLVANSPTTQVRGTLGVTVIIIGNGISDPSCIFSGQSCLYFTLCWYFCVRQESIFFSHSYGWIVGKTDLFSFSKVTSLEEGKLNSNQLYSP